MEGMLQPPSATAFDAAASTVSLLVYLAVAIGVVAGAPRDSRARVFLAVTLTGAAPYALSPLQWWKGPAFYTPLVITLTSVSFAIGSVALFHFTQVFPGRRPWIRAHILWLAVAYIVLPIPVAVISWIVSSLLAPGASGAGGIGAVSPDAGVALLLLLMIPIFVVGIVLPFAGILSLFKSWQEAKSASDGAARTTTFWMMVSQLAGGILAILVLPLLHVMGVATLWATLFAALTYAFALLMPLTFAVAAWRYGMLNHPA
jgi:hypothetical protein